MSQLHQLVHKIAQNPAQIKEILASLKDPLSHQLAKEEETALHTVLQNGSLALNVGSRDCFNISSADLVNLWVRPES